MATTDTGLGRFQSLWQRNLIVLSADLERITGYSICDRLKKSTALKEITVVMISTKDTFEPVPVRKLQVRSMGA